MPYIRTARRPDLLTGDAPRGSGELNFLLTSVLLAYLDPLETACYDDFNEVLGVLEAVKQEFYRRVVVPYEERKRAENGDVFPKEVV